MPMGFWKADEIDEWNLINGDFIEIKEGPYDLIMLVYSFEHMLDLNEVVTKVQSLLKGNGFVYLEIPGLRGLIKKLN